jgi:hypothetical protein
MRTRSLWQYPWQYIESFMIGLAVIILGTAVEVITKGMDIHAIGAPYNIYVAFIFVSLLIFLRISYRKRDFVIWMSSVPAAISAIFLFAALVFLLGFIPQETLHATKIYKLTGLSHLKTSWPFLFIQVYFLSILGMVTLRRIIPLKFKNIGFFLNHFGLWLILLAGCLGSGDLQRLTISLLDNGQESNIGVSSTGAMFKLPFTLKLIHFTMDEYPPKMMMLDAKTGQSKMDKGLNYPIAGKGVKAKINDWNIEVVQYLPNAVVFDSIFQPSEERGNYQAANIKAVRSSTHDTVRGWISTGSYLEDASFLSLKGNNVLILATPEARKYTSKIEIKTDKPKNDTITLEVNKPYRIKDWTIYQVSYDQSKGKWSSLSVLEAVSDPWLKVVYTGIGMLLLGAVYMIWIGRGKKS